MFCIDVVALALGLLFYFRIFDVNKYYHFLVFDNICQNIIIISLLFDEIFDKYCHSSLISF